ncbi:MAG: PAS domain S-box protein [Sporomusaceae bacterium]|nr:PAS domain S-box protein [Sporomusaceae bacterium]
MRRPAAAARAQATAASQVQQLSAAVEQSPCSIVITDLEGNIEYVNPKFTAVTGYSSAEAIGQNPRILKSGHQPPELYRTMWDTIAAGNEWQGEFQNKRKNGSVFWELASISPIRNAQGQATHYLAIKEDITDRKQVEDRISRDMELSSRIQRGFLPPQLDNSYLTVRQIYQPYKHVGGDIFDYCWHANRRVLSGYLADVMGHGIGTALQAAALRVLFHQADERQLSPAAALRWVNAKVSNYFAEDSFAAAIYFQLDFNRREAAFSIAGINQLFVWNRSCAGLVSQPGIYLGIQQNPEYETYVLPLDSGDTFLLLTDGLFDLLTDRAALAALPSAAAWAELEALLGGGKATDDASALSITVK